MNVAQFATQIRMARSAIDWTLRMAATGAHVAPDTVTRAEQGDETISNGVWVSLQNLYEIQGVEFYDDGGVRLREPIKEGIVYKLRASMELPMQRALIHEPVDNPGNYNPIKSNQD